MEDSLGIPKAGTIQERAWKVCMRKHTNGSEVRSVQGFGGPSVLVQSFWNIRLLIDLSPESD